MDKETWSLVISVIGLALGVLAAHAQLKAIAKKALKASGDKARTWIARMETDADLYSANPSVLISFLAKEFLMLLKFFFLTVAMLAVLKAIASLCLYGAAKHSCLSMQCGLAISWRVFHTLLELPCARQERVTTMTANSSFKPTPLRGAA
ncbi:hypothetical protein [Stenotrophomonas mori]|uniref:Uncharacterized protein n=1 Tax=Stenotrophomonas mori TaxID=2871096 RepID=A0ABT0SIG3_9GAMM|nr:hypothetical protein [Stenotrophomonas mori]MCL7715133.1 hypothetical protein [Stenotrophomonas mori]